jgi:hypothetical protein
MSNGSLTDNPKPLLKAIIFIFIVFCIALQAHAGVIRLACGGVALPYLCSLPNDPSLYPFLNYSMYRSAKPQGVIVPKFLVIATYPDGTEQQLTAEDFGLSDYWFSKGIIHSLDDKENAKTLGYIEAYNRSGKRPIASLRLDVIPLALERKGVVKGETYTLHQVFANEGKAN